MSTTRTSIPPRSWWYRLPRYHLPLALATALTLALLLTVPAFDATRYHGFVDILSSAFPQARGEGGGGLMDHGQDGPTEMDHGQDQDRPTPWDHGRDEDRPTEWDHEGNEAEPGGDL